MNESGQQPENREKAKDERLDIPESQREEAIQKEGDIVSERARRGVETPHIAQAPQDEPAKLTMSEVKTKVDFRKWVETYDKIFTDPTDKESNTTLARFFYSPDLARYYLLKDDNKKDIGVQLHRINPNIPEAGYTPYGGLVEGSKGLNVYPKMAKLADQQLKELGVKYMMNDCEDPSRINPTEAYPDENPQDVIDRCNRRLNFFRRSMGQMFVNDPEIPYCRPSSENTKDIQAYDLLGFRPTDIDDPMWKNIFNEDKTMIRKEAYGDMYLKLMQLEYGDKNSVPSKEELRKEYPAIDRFFTDFDNCKKEWVMLHADAIRQKNTPNKDVTIDVEKGHGWEEQRNRWQHVPRNGMGWERPLSPPSSERQDRLANLKDVKLPDPMTEEEMKGMIRKIADTFGTDNDPTQAAPSVEQFKGLQAVDPYSLLLQKDDKGNVVGWSGIVPVSKELADQFADGKINEAQIIAGAIEKPGYDALYHWAFYTDPDVVKSRPKDSTLDFVEAQFKKLMERHPTISDHVAWGYSEAGAAFMHKMEQDLGIRIRKSPGSF